MMRHNGSKPNSYMIEETVENLEVLNSPEEKNEKSDFLTKFVTKPFKAVIKMAGLELSKCHYVSLSVNIFRRQKKKLVK